MFRPANIPEGANQLILRFPGSSRTRILLLILIAMVLIGSAIWGEFDRWEKILRGLSGVATLAGFTALLAWNFSFSVGADREGLATRSLFGGARISWGAIGSIEGRRVAQIERGPSHGQITGMQTERMITRYTVIRDAAGTTVIQIRTDLVPAEVRRRLVELAQDALHANRQGNADAGARDPVPPAVL